LDFQKNCKAVLEDTALVAGWSPLGHAQLRYVKRCTLAGIVASRLIRNPDNLPLIEEKIVKNPETFHNIKMNKPVGEQKRRVDLKGVCSINISICLIHSSFDQNINKFQTPFLRKKLIVFYKKQKKSNLQTKEEYFGTPPIKISFVILQMI
jgi:hypothetical protein